MPRLSRSPPVHNVRSHIIKRNRPSLKTGLMDKRSLDVWRMSP
ncbi:MAG TPA: hypothetical protein V6D30_10565 [Leptolyngbyaceae cyanobacterium]